MQNSQITMIASLLLNYLSHGTHDIFSCCEVHILGLVLKSA